MQNQFSGSLPQITDESQRQPIGNRQINPAVSDNELDDRIANDINRLYKNEFDEPESKNVQDMIKHGEKKTAKKHQQSFEPFK